MNDWVLPEVERGGVDMSPKTDPHDLTTPSGRFPLIVPMPLWKAMEAEGWDMRWYAVSRPLPHS